jgi:hypothetical protein
MIRLQRRAQFDMHGPGEDRASGEGRTERYCTVGGTVGASVIAT